MQEVRPHADVDAECFMLSMPALLDHVHIALSAPKRTTEQSNDSTTAVPWMLPGVKAGLVTSGEQRMHGHRPQRTQGPAVLSARRFSSCQASTKRRS